MGATTVPVAEWAEMPAGWPAQLREGSVQLRPLRLRDARAWRQVRAANAAWLNPWEATSPEVGTAPPSFRQMVTSVNRQARAGRMLPFAVVQEDRFVGQLTVGGITWGSLRSANIGYWVDERVAGRGIIPTALALSIDHCFFGLGLHRIEVNIRPENLASLRVVGKLGLRDEGLRERYLHIDGAWRDHRTFALTVDEVPAGVLGAWRRYAREPSASTSVSPTSAAPKHGAPEDS